MTDEELAEELGESERALMNLRFRVATMQIANVNEIREDAQANSENPHPRETERAGGGVGMSFERRKIRVGKVTADKMDKTVSVSVEWRRAHPLYRKSMRRRTQLKAHDAENLCRVGDLVRVMETRPVSKTKRWRVVEILSRADLADIQPEEIAAPETIAEEPQEAQAPMPRSNKRSP